MAVTSVSKMFAGQGGRRSLKGERSYNVSWMVQVSDPKDGAAVVLSAVREWLGRSITGFANDIDSGVRCTELQADRVADTRLVWMVQGTFSTPEDDDEKDGDGQGNENPETWRDEVEWGTVRVSVPVEKAKINTDLPKIRRKSGSFGPVVNSAGDVFDPPPEREESHGVLRITRYMPGFPSQFDLAFQDVVNADTVIVQKPGIVRAFQKYTLKMEPILGSLNWKTLSTGVEIFYWKNTFEFHWRKRTWRDDLANLGRNRRATEGDPNGRGDEYAEIPESQKFQPQLARIRDEDDFPVGPVLLDLDGQPLPLNKKDAVYINYSYYEEKNYFPDLIKVFKG
jgi:hypothetical protein